VIEVLAVEAASSQLTRFDVEPWMWAGFIALVVVALLVDLLVLHREAHVITFREAAIASTGWIALGVGFTFVVWWLLGGPAATQYVTGYVIEKSLSIDNVFVWSVIFTSFAVPAMYQHRVLFWGIFGALVMRAVFIFAGVAILERLEWVLFIFGGFLVFTAVRVYREPTGEVHPEQNRVSRFVRRFIPVTTRYDGQRFFTIEAAKRVATPLFIVLVLIEATDVVFAVDSVPAVLAISRDPFVVFSSNALAILGLRALYFLLAGARDRLVYLHRGLGVILFFVGVKMIISPWLHISSLISLALIAVVLTITVIASLRAPRLILPSEPPPSPGASDHRSSGDG
jgi:tellurite resistance protein TerC